MSAAARIIALILVVALIFSLCCVSVSALTEYNLTSDQMYNLTHYTDPTLALLDSAGNSEGSGNFYGPEEVILDGNTGSTWMYVYSNPQSDYAVRQQYTIPLYLPYGGVLDFFIPYQYSVESVYGAYDGSTFELTEFLEFQDGYDYFSFTYVDSADSSYGVPDVESYSISIDQPCEYLVITLNSAQNVGSYNYFGFVGITAFTNPTEGAYGSTTEELSNYLNLIYAYLSGDLASDMDLINSNLDSIINYLKLINTSIDTFDKNLADILSEYVSSDFSDFIVDYCIAIFNEIFSNGGYFSQIYPYALPIKLPDEEAISSYIWWSDYQSEINSAIDSYLVSDFISMSSSGDIPYLLFDDLSFFVPELLKSYVSIFIVRGDYYKSQEYKDSLDAAESEMADYDDAMSSISRPGSSDLPFDDASDPNSLAGIIGNQFDTTKEYTMAWWMRERLFTSSSVVTILILIIPSFAVAGYVLFGKKA